jgi:hypothetical protein
MMNTHYEERISNWKWRKEGVEETRVKITDFRSG